MDRSSSADSREAPAATAILFDADGADRVVEPLDGLSDIPDEQVYWLILSGPEARLPPLAGERIALPEPDAGGVTVAADHFSFTVPAAPNPAGHATGRMTFVVGRNWLVTWSDHPLELTRQYLDADTGKTLKGSLTATALAVSLMMAHFDEFHAQLAGIGRAIDQFDEQVFRWREHHDPLAQLAVLRRRTARLREAVACHRRVIVTLDRPDFGPEVCADDRRHLGHLDEAYNRLVDTVDRTREAVLASFDLYATRVAQDTNRLLERLTIITIGLGMIGALAGIMGMNFKLPLFEHGAPPFWVTIAVMAVIAGVTLSLTALRRGRP